RLAADSKRRHGRHVECQRNLVPPRPDHHRRRTLNMNAASRAGWLLDQEARALLTRLSRVRPFVLFETMVPAAAPSAHASAAIHEYLAQMAVRLRQMVIGFLSWLRTHHRLEPARMQRRFTLLRLRFNVMMSQFDIFADVVTQRSEYQTG